MKNMRTGVKKAQIQTTETIFVVIIIIVIVLISLVVYGRVQEANMKEKQREQRVLRLISIAHSVSNWPELECSTLESREFDCADAVKLGLIAPFINERVSEDSYAFNYYQDLLRRSSIVVREVYSYGSDLRTWVVYNRTGNRSTSEMVFVPLNVYDPVEQTFTFAIMELAVYE